MYWRMSVWALDHEGLSFFHNGWYERLIGPTDDVEVVRRILA